MILSPLEMETGLLSPCRPAWRVKQLHQMGGLAKRAGFYFFLCPQKHDAYAHLDRGCIHLGKCMAVIGKVRAQLWMWI